MGTNGADGTPHPAGSEGLLLPETLTKDLLKTLFENAYMDVSIDSDGDLMIKEQYRAWAIPANDGKYVRLYSLFKSKPEAADADKLAYVNKVNNELVILRAYVTETGGFGFEWYIPIEGGITRHAMVSAVRRFHRLLDPAIAKDEKDVVG